MCNCSESGCGSGCGQPKTYVTETGPQGEKGENLIYSEYNAGGTVVSATYTQVAATSYSLTSGSLDNGDYVKYITEVTNSGSTSVSRYIKIMLNDEWAFASASPDTLAEITLASGVKRAIVEFELLKKSNTTAYITLTVKKLDTSNALTSTQVYYFNNVDLSALSNPCDLSINNLEISTYYKGDATNGLTHLKTKVLQYNQQ